MAHPVSTLIESCFRATLHIRGQEIADYILDGPNGVNARLAKWYPGTMALETTITTPDGNTMRMIDMQGTLEMLGLRGIRQEVRDEILELGKHFDELTDDGWSHSNLLREVQKSLGSYISGATGC